MLGLQFVSNKTTEQIITVKIKTAASQDLLSSAPWLEYDLPNGNSDLQELNFPAGTTPDYGQYVQYEVDMTGDPTLYSLGIKFKRTIVPWLETRRGDIYSGGSITLNTPSTNAYNAIYIIRGQSIASAKSQMPGKFP